MRTISSGSIEYVTATVGGQRLGLPVLGVQDVFAPDRVAPVPLAPADVVGLMNLRGRIVTIVDLRVRLALDDGPRGIKPMVVGADFGGESYGFLVDAIGEVVPIEALKIETVPANIEADLAGFLSGVYRLENELLLLIDIAKLFEHGDVAAAA